jgi:hypothetical protein
MLRRPAPWPALLLSASVLGDKLKYIKRCLALLAFWVAGSAHAAAVPACVPYTIAVPATVVACGPGMSGSKFKTTTMSCPSGAISQSTAYDTSGCVALPAAPGVANTVSKCLVTPDACAPLVTTSNCPTGTHWTLLGSRIAHCVQDDFACGWGQRLTHDTLGNPSCVANTCPSGQTLQADGVSCASPTPPPPPPPPPTVTCTSGTYADAAACSPGGGVMTRFNTTTCPSGIYGSPSISYGPWNTSYCSCTNGGSGWPACGVATPPPPPPSAPIVSCTPSTTSESGTCSPGTGSTSRSVVTSCPAGPYGSPSTAWGSWNTGSCRCTNGGTDWPTCTPPVPIKVYSYAWRRTSTSCGSGGYPSANAIGSCTAANSGQAVWTADNGSPCASGGFGNSIGLYVCTAY